MIMEAVAEYFCSSSISLVLHIVQPFVLLGRVLFIFCQYNRLSSTLTMPSSFLNISLKFVIHLSWTWVIRTANSNFGLDPCWCMVQRQSSSFWVILIISPWLWQFPQFLCFSYGTNLSNFPIKVTWYSFVQTVSPFMLHFFAMYFLSAKDSNGKWKVFF